MGGKGQSKWKDNKSWMSPISREPTFNANVGPPPGQWEGSGSQSNSWTAMGSQTTPLVGDPYYEANRAPLQFERSDDVFGRMARGSAGMAEIIFHREADTGNTVEVLETFYRRHVGGKPYRPPWNL